MAVTKLWSVTERLGQVIDYATNPEKTSANIKREFSPEQYQALADVIARILRRGQRLWKKTLSISKQRNKNSRERRNHAMNNGGDAAEQVVRLSLEGFEVAARLSGSAAKNIALLLVSVLKQEQKTKGKARLLPVLFPNVLVSMVSLPNSSDTYLWVDCSFPPR